MPIKIMPADTKKRKAKRGQFRAKSFIPGQIPKSFVKSNSNQILFRPQKSNQIGSNFLY